jgi:DNA adenine methylase
MDVQIEHRDYGQIITTYDAPETLFYCDPPYVTDTRETGSRAAYTHEMDEWSHIALIERLLGCRGKVILSGYDNVLYTPLRVAGWSCQQIVRTSMAANQREVTAKSTRTESLWFNPAAQQAMEVAS